MKRFRMCYVERIDEHPEGEWVRFKDVASMSEHAQNCATSNSGDVMTLLTDDVLATAMSIKLACDTAEALMLVDYPENVLINGVKFSFSVLIEEAQRRAPRVIKRVMTDGIKTKDGLS